MARSEGLCQKLFSSEQWNVIQYDDGWVDVQGTLNPSSVLRSLILIVANFGVDSIHSLLILPRCPTRVSKCRIHIL